MRIVLVLLGLLIVGCTPDSISVSVWRSRSEYHYFEDSGIENGVQVEATWELGE